jgi:hypothetical protein
MSLLKKLLSSLLLVVALCRSTGVYADDQASIEYVQDFYSLFMNIDPTQVNVELEPLFDNLLCFEATFAPEIRVGLQKGIVDDGGNYVIFDADLTSNPKEIQKLLNTTTRFATGQLGSNDFLNLLAYVGPEGQLYYIDSANRYALLYGQIIDFNSNYFSSINVYLGQFNDLSSPLPAVGPSPFPYKQAKCWATFRQGRADAPKTIYVLGDPNCPFCHYFYEGLKPYVDSGELSIHWGFVTFVQTNSRGKAWAIFDGDTPPDTGYPATPQGAFDYNEDNFDLINEEGGIPPTNTPSKQAIRALTKDLNDASAVGLPGIPYVIYKNTSGQTTVSIGSVPTPSSYYADFVASIQSK